MQKITVLCVGKLKERFYQEAAAEYVKRLGRHCKLDVVELPESRLPESPSPAEVQRALAAEAAAIREKVSGLVMKHTWALQVHGFYVDRKAKTMRFDVVVTFGRDRDAIVRELEKEVGALYPGYRVSVDVDRDPRAVYFKQVRNGKDVRKALIATLLRWKEEM